MSGIDQQKTNSKHSKDVRDSLYTNPSQGATKKDHLTSGPGNVEDRPSFAEQGGESTVSSTTAAATAPAVDASREHMKKYTSHAKGTAVKVEHSKLRGPNTGERKPVATQQKLAKEPATQRAANKPTTARTVERTTITPAAGRQHEMGKSRDASLQAAVKDSSRAKPSLDEIKAKHAAGKEFGKGRSLDEIKATSKAKAPSKANSQSRSIGMD